MNPLYNPLYPSYNWVKLKQLNVELYNLYYPAKDISPLILVVINSNGYASTKVIYEHKVAAKPARHI